MFQSSQGGPVSVEDHEAPPDGPVNGPDQFLTAEPELGEQSEQQLHAVLVVWCGAEGG